MADHSNHKFRPTIDKIFRLNKDRKGNVISVEDALNNGKLKFTASGFGKGVNADYVYCNVDFDEALMLAHFILNGTFAKAFPVKEVQTFGKDTVVAEYLAYKGSPKSDAYEGKPESRTIEIRGMLSEDRDGKPVAKYSITMWVGPGKQGPTGAIMPAVNRSAMISQRVYLSLADITKMFLKIKMHIEAYYSHNFTEMYDPKTGTIIKGFRNDIFTDPNAVRRVTETAQPASMPSDEYIEEVPSAYEDAAFEPEPVVEPEPEPVVEEDRYSIDI